MSLPTGVVTFLLSDIEASTLAWEADRAAMARAVARHYEILDAAIAIAGGVRPVEQGEGDSVVAAFVKATDALRAAVDIQLALAAEWPDHTGPAVRIALHTGEAELRDEDNYFGPTIIRCARLRTLAHGGQILCSRATADLVADALPGEVRLRDLGTHRLKDLTRPEHVFGVGHPNLRAEFPALRSPARPGVLPVAMTSFVGREAALTVLLELAQAHRMLTLTGCGGAGKTRLAGRLATDLTSRHDDGVWFVDLAPLADPDLVADTVLAVLGVGDLAGATAPERLRAHLAGRDLLLVLDNCEHVVDACAALVNSLLRTCGGLWVLATSREALGVEGEAVWQVPSMGSDGVALFLERARQARPNFVAEDRSVVADICARLDGIPLAIELAAARTRVLTPDRILAELEDRFRLLTGRTRGALARQQTLEASVAWSHDLLTEAERTLFRRLAVFAGGFALDAAESVGPAVGGALDTGRVIDLVEALVAKSMLVVADPAGGRYRLLETMRAFASRELASAGETTAARDAHLAYYDGRLPGWEREIAVVNPSVLRRYTVDADNYRAALDWALSGSDGDAAVRLIGRWVFVSLFSNRYLEANQWAQRAVALPDLSGETRVFALYMLGGAKYVLLDLAALGATVAQMLALAEDNATPTVLARAYHLEAMCMAFTDPPAALQLIDVALLHARAADDVLVEMDCALRRLLVFMRADDLANAHRASEESFGIATELGKEFYLAMGQMWAAEVHVRAGDFAAARAAATQGVRLAESLSQVQCAAMCTVVLAAIDVAQGQPQRALHLADGTPIAEWSDTADAWALGTLLTVRGRALHALGRLDEARDALVAALATCAALGDPWQHGQAALALAHLHVETGETSEVPALAELARACAATTGSPRVAAVADHVRGLATADLAAAENLQHAALAVHAAQGYAPDLVDTVEAIAELAARHESWAEAVRLIAAMAQRRGELGYHAGARTAENTLAAARSALGPEAYDAARVEGEALSVAAAVAYVSRARGERGRPTHGWASLTPTELDVVRLAAQGASNPEIGRALFVSPHTVKTHLSHVYVKLGLANRAELAAEVARRG